jgi:serine O-acetyltransferase
MTNPSNFKFLSCLRADLTRARGLLNGDYSSPSGLRLWLGLLSFRFLPILLYRFSYLFYSLNIKSIAKLFSFINFFFFGIEISIRCHIGRGLFFPHTHGTVIGAWNIGENVTIFQGVTIGARELDFDYKEENRPKIQDGVIIGAGAKVIGGVTVGFNARIGANAVVIEDVPPSSLAVGVPARIIV